MDGQALERVTKNQQKQPEPKDQGVFPTSLSEQELVEARRKSALSRILGSSCIFRTPENRIERPDLQAHLIIRNKANEHYENGAEAITKSQFSKAVNCFYKAINLQPKQTELYVSQAEAFLQMCDFQSAVVSYKQACLLASEAKPFQTRMAFIYYLQGQCLYDQGMFLGALESFTKAAELKPDFRSYHVRRLACLTALGHYGDCLKLVTSWLDAGCQTSDLFTLRARLYKQLNQVAPCYHDLKSALALNPGCSEAGECLRGLEEVSDRAKQMAVRRVLAGELPGALASINSALEHCPENGHHYLFRGILYRRLKDFTAAIEDLVLAVELSEAGERDPEGDDTQEDLKAVQEDAKAQLVLTYNDFAVHCYSHGHYAEAAMLLTKAIAEQKEERGLYINRGDCFFKQAEWEFAMADYQQAQEMASDDHSIWVRLAVIHNTRGILLYQERKGSIKYNPGVSQYYENRAKAQQKVPNMEGAKHDAICTLILDPTNDQVVPLLLSLFPGCSVSDVLSSETSRTVRAQLMDTIQACKQTLPTEPSLCRGFDRITLSQGSDSQSDNQSEDWSDAGEELNHCVAQPEMFHEVIRNNKQVKQAVRLALERRPPLHYAGPRLAPVLKVELEQSALSSEKRPYNWRKFKGF
ncbi:tetratricopeptide repeat protein 16 [Hypomesus transpacificus]|uniref:tetratricopeptide repeat protein 16 n=1 Tax=Hypomesus transpacificus TaxID=137520 RepID=UPI001F075A81|nr:tetratricopeptide repeat protein 16 [Hypomesus transpacificus]